jgi:hypothetical protein
MAFVSFVSVDGKKYVTPARAWMPVETKPSQVRITLAGALDTTYGEKCLLEWRGDLMAPYAVTDSSFGTISDLLTSLRKKTQLTFIDHFEVSRSADISGQMARRSITPIWNANSTKWYISVTIKAVE